MTISTYHEEFIKIYENISKHSKELSEVGNNLTNQSIKRTTEINEKGMVALLTKMSEFEIKQCLKNSDKALSFEGINITKRLMKKYDVYNMKPYSIFNVWYLIRKDCREFSKAWKTIRELKTNLRFYFDELKGLEEKIDPYKTQDDKTVTLLDAIYELKKRTHEILQHDFIKHPNHIQIYKNTFFMYKTISKNQLLSFLSIARKKDEWDGTRNNTYQELVVSMPEQIDYEQFQDYVFVNIIEEESDRYIFDQYRYYFINATKEIPELKEWMSNELNEIFNFDSIATISVQTDEFGEITHVEQAPPKK